MSGTCARVMRWTAVIVGLPSTVSIVSRASVSMAVAVKPALLSVNDSAIVKQPAWAAAMSSSGFVPLPSPNRALNEYGVSRSVPLCTESVAAAFLRRALPAGGCLALHGGFPSGCGTRSLIPPPGPVADAGRPRLRYHSATSSADRAGAPPPMTKPKTTHFDTLSLHAGARPDPATGARATPIYQSASFVFPDSDHAAALFNMERAGHVYSRISNPTCAVLEERIAALEGGVGAIATASGQAALHLAIVSLHGRGQPHRRVARALRRLAQPARLHAAALRRRDDVRRSARHRRMARAPSGPRPASCSARRSAIRASTCSTSRAWRSSRTSTDCRSWSMRRSPRPTCMQPFAHGADLVFHSATKFLSGHGVVIGGLLVDSGQFDWDGPKARGKFPTLTEPYAGFHDMVFTRGIHDRRIPAARAARGHPGLRRVHGAVHGVPDPAGDRDAAAADGAPRRQRAPRRRVSRRAPDGGRRRLSGAPGPSGSRARGEAACPEAAARCSASTSRARARRAASSSRR